jgi:hypothetical protein
MATAIQPNDLFQFPSDPNVGVLACMDSSGDTKVQWNRNNPDSVETARLAFEKLTKKGQSAFRVNRDGSQGERMTTFDPQAEGVILVPQYQGG